MTSPYHRQIQQPKAPKPVAPKPAPVESVVNVAKQTAQNLLHNLSLKKLTGKR